jgi:hypothetical protein
VRFRLGDLSSFQLFCDYLHAMARLFFSFQRDKIPSKLTVWIIAPAHSE